MKKSILSLTLVIVAVLCSSCFVNMRYFMEGRASPRLKDSVLNMAGNKMVGTAESEGECNIMAGEAEFLHSYYDPDTKECHASTHRGVLIGDAETKDACIEMGKAGGYSRYNYAENTKRCFGNK